MPVVLCQGLCLLFENNPWFLHFQPYNMLYRCYLYRGFATPHALFFNPGMSVVSLRGL